MSSSAERVSAEGSEGDVRGFGFALAAARIWVSEEWGLKDEFGEVPERELWRDGVDGLAVAIGLVHILMVGRGVSTRRLTTGIAVVVS